VNKRDTASFILVGIASCVSGVPLAPHPANFGPAVSEACLDAARNGNLVRGAPANAGRYRITHLENGVLLLKGDGRPLTDVEGKAVFDSFRATGMASGSTALASVYTCPDTPRASCLVYSMWLCQTSFERIAGELDAALQAAGAPDGELALMLRVLERPPRCPLGTTCPLDRHYGPVQGTYHPDKPRWPLGGSGRCTRDSDCEGAESNGCTAWYLKGGIEPLVDISYSIPVFCGCVAGACTWFAQ
jgi:hypothetical protein